MSGLFWLVALVGAVVVASDLNAQDVAREAGAERRTTTPVFSDDFESGQRSNAHGGGRWASTGQRVTVQKDDKAGSKFALDFFFPARDPGRMSTAEQRFALAEGVKELWLEYDFFLPSNFFHRQTGKGANNKFLALWEEDYSALNGEPLLAFEFRPMNDVRKRSGKNGDSYLYVHARDRVGKMRNRGQPALNAFSDAQRGRWNSIRVHVRLATGENVNDGLIELWMNGKRIIAADGLALPGGEKHYLRRGYFMGWSNSGYTADTHFKIDNVRFYAKSPDQRPGL